MVSCDFGEILFTGHSLSIVIDLIAHIDISVLIGSGLESKREQLI